MITLDALAPLAGQFLARQRWFAGSPEEAAAAEVLATDVLLPGGPPDRPALGWVLIGVAGVTYQVLVGVRPEAEALALLAGQEAAVLGSLGDGTVAYDALADPELALVLLQLVTGGAERAERVRPVGGEQSNSSMVYDERLIMKVFRRVTPGINPDVEVSLALDEVGFNHVAAPVGTWRRDELDCAIVRELLVGGTEGWALALTSLRDLYGRGVGGLAPDPSTPVALGPEVAAAAGGDFGPEARRLGEMTAKLHLALAEALGTEPGDACSWADDVDAQLVAAGLDRSVGAALTGALRCLDRPGLAIRVHGDYHLGQVMRTDIGWFVLDFEGEPARPLAERRRRRSALKDVAGMLRSFDYATAAALRARPDEAGYGAALGGAWRARNRASFLAGYLATSGIDELMPGTAEGLDVVLSALEVEKAAYELAYERAYRPGWVDIPARALESLLGVEGISDE